MTYPFPGMNPFLENRDVWHDFHQRLVPRLGDAVAEQIRPRYRARIDDNVYIHDLAEDQRAMLGRRDVAIVETGGTIVDARRSGTIASPMMRGILLPDSDEVRESFVEIRDNTNNILVTVIELLSPTNKRPGVDRDQYRAKRRQLLHSTVHLVEIDLHRIGVRPEVQHLPDCDYNVMVSRYEDRPSVGLWPCQLKDRLPKIPIPLNPDDQDVVIDLQELVEAQFEAADYEDYVYKSSPEPALNPDDAAWAKSLLET